MLRGLYSTGLDPGEAEAGVEEVRRSAVLGREGKLVQIRAPDELQDESAEHLPCTGSVRSTPSYYLI